MTRHTLLAFLTLTACSGEGPSTSEASGERVETGPPEAPAFPTAPGKYQVAWTTELMDASRVGPPLPAGATVQVVAINDDVASVRTEDDPPRAGKLPVNRLISGTRMQPGVLIEMSQIKPTLEAAGGESTPPLTLVLPYQARAGHRGIVGPSGEARWIQGSVLAHDPGELAIGAQVAAVRWSLGHDDELGARLRLRSLPMFAAEDSEVLGIAMSLYSALLGEEEPFEVVEDRLHDPESGLSWRRCADGQGWSMQRERCEGPPALLPLRRAETSCGSFRSEDGAWRLPSVEEFQSVLLCTAGRADDDSCTEPQMTATLVPAFQTPPERMWTRDRGEGGQPLVLDLSTGEVVPVGADTTAGALCVTETFDGNTYLQTTTETVSATAASDVEGGADPESLESLDADMMFLTAMPAHVPEDELDDLMVQLRTPRGVRWVARRDLKEPAYPVQAVTVEGVLLPEGALKTGDCVELFGPSDRITAGEGVRVTGPGELTGTLNVEVERGCSGSNGLTFRNIASVAIGGPALRVRSDAEDPCKDIGGLIPPTLRENMSGRLPNHPVLCAEWRFEEVDPFFPGATEQYRAYLEENVVVEGSAFTGWVVDGQLINATPVVADAVYTGGPYNLVASSTENALRRTTTLVVHQATIGGWKEVTTRLATGGGPRDETFTFDPETGDLNGSMGMHCRFDAASEDYVCE